MWGVTVLTPQESTKKSNDTLHRKKERTVFGWATQSHTRNDSRAFLCVFFSNESKASWKEHFRNRFQIVHVDGYIRLIFCVSVFFEKSFYAFEWSHTFIFLLIQPLRATNNKANDFWERKKNSQRIIAFAALEVI